MYRNAMRIGAALLPLVTLLIGGCPGLDIIIPGLTGVRVQVINDTSFRVRPDIRFDDDDDDLDAFLAGVFGGDQLTTGTLDPDEFVEFTFDCDELGLVFADESEQLLLGQVIGESDDTDTLQRGEEFDCGDVIRFRFIGSFDDFDVVVSVNGRVVD